MCMSACDSVCELAYIGMHTTVCMYLEVRVQYCAVSLFPRIKTRLSGFHGQHLYALAPGFFWWEGSYFKQLLYNSSWP